MTVSHDARRTSALWSRWGALTRSLISTRVAVERERSFWDSLNFTDADWSQVEGGLAGAVEVGVIRNLIVHGAENVDAKSYQRLVAAGCTRFASGSSLTLDYEAIGLYRARLRSLLMIGGLGSTSCSEEA